MSAVATPSALRPDDFLDVDSLLSDEERLVTYEGTADVHALVVGGALTDIQAFR